MICLSLDWVALFSYFCKSVIFKVFRSCWQVFIFIGFVTRRFSSVLLTRSISLFLILPAFRYFFTYPVSAIHSIELPHRFTLFSTTLVDAFLPMTLGSLEFPPSVSHLHHSLPIMLLSIAYFIPLLRPALATVLSLCHFVTLYAVRVTAFLLI